MKMMLLPTSFSSLLCRCKGFNNSDNSDSSKFSSSPIFLSVASVVAMVAQQAQVASWTSATLANSSSIYRAAQSSGVMFVNMKSWLSLIFTIF